MYRPEPNHLTSATAAIKFSSVVLVLSQHSFGSRALIAVVRTGKRVKIPRCRATVSEEICYRSPGEILGRPVAIAGY